MKKELPATCFLCGKTIRYGKGNKKAESQGLVTGANTHDLDCKSEMHHAHCGGKNSRKQFEDINSPVWEKMGVINHCGSKICCYECHEVICHNPVLTESQMNQLASLFRGKSFEDRVVILNCILASGLAAMKQDSQDHSRSH